MIKILKRRAREQDVGDRCRKALGWDFAVKLPVPPFLGFKVRRELLPSKMQTNNDLKSSNILFNPIPYQALLLCLNV